MKVIKKQRGIAWLLSLCLLVSMFTVNLMVVKADGEGNPGQTITLDFSEGTINGNKITYTVNIESRNVDVEITCPETISDSKANVGMNDEFTVGESFDTEKMEIVVQASDGFNTTLTVSENRTKLANKNNGDGGLPSELKFIVRAKGNDGPPSGGRGEFSGKVYFIWRGNGDKLCVHYMENLKGGLTDENANYIDIDSIKDGNTGEQFTFDSKDSVYWLWEDSKNFLYNEGEPATLKFSNYSELDDAFRDEETRRKYAIDPAGFENSNSMIGTYGDRSFRAFVIDKTTYEAISFSKEKTDYKYFPIWWDQGFTTSNLDISGTTVNNPAVYEAFILEPSINFTKNENSIEEIKDVTPIDVPNGAVTVSESEGKWSISFKNNFYDRVKFELRSDTKSYYMEIERVSIQAFDNFGPGQELSDQMIRCQVYRDNSKAESDFDVYATKIYRDGSKSMIKLDAKDSKPMNPEENMSEMPGGDGLYYAEYQIPMERDLVAIAFNAVTAGALSGNVFSGAYIGSGQGTYYDIDARRIIY